MGELERTESNVERPNNKNLSSDISCGLTSGFWDSFAESVWERTTFVKKNNFVTPPISEEELFKCVVDMSIKHCEIREEGGEETDVRVYVKGIEVEKDYARLFPKLSDGSFAGYSKRVSKELEGQPFAFVIDAITMPESLKVWTHSFLKDMYRPLGAMSSGHFWSIFFGEYSTTPYGVHDHMGPFFSESAFYFPIVGEKEMTVWPPSYVDKNPDLKESHDYAEHLPGATRLSAEAGGMMYWPSDRWHIGSSEGGDVSIVLAVRAFSDIYFQFLCSIKGAEVFKGIDIMSSYGSSGIRKWLCYFIESFLFSGYVVRLFLSQRARQNQLRKLPCDVDDLQASAQVIPEGLQKIGRRLNIRFYFGKNIEKALSAFWMFYLTNLGVESQNDPFPVIKLVPELRAQRSTGIILLWRQVDSETLLLVADRYAHEMPSVYLPLIEYIGGIGAGEEIVYGKLVGMVSELGIPSQNSEEELGGLLEFLGESGTFRLPSEIEH